MAAQEYLCSVGKGKMEWNQPPPYDGSLYTGLPKKFHEKFSQADIKEDDLQILANYDTVFIVDDSGSMEGHLWYEACDALSELAAIAAGYDEDGIDIYFLNKNFWFSPNKKLKSEKAVRDLFKSVSPGGFTPTGARLKEIVGKRLKELEKGESCRMTNYIVITDGIATDNVEGAIAKITERLRKMCAISTQIGIQFVQIGHNYGASCWLKKLDNNKDFIKEKCMGLDIVDTTPYDKDPEQKTLTSTQLVKILVGAINRKIDKQG